MAICPPALWVELPQAPGGCAPGTLLRCSPLGMSPPLLHRDLESNTCPIDFLISRRCSLTSPGLRTSQECAWPGFPPMSALLDSRTEMRALQRIVYKHELTGAHCDACVLSLEARSQAAVGSPCRVPVDGECIHRPEGMRASSPSFEPLEALGTAVCHGLFAAASPSYQTGMGTRLQHVDGKDGVPGKQWMAFSSMPGWACSRKCGAQAAIVAV